MPFRRPTPHCLGRGHRGICILLFTWTISLASLPGSAQERANPPASPSAPLKAAFTQADALRILDNLQAALQSYNRKKFLAEFAADRMPNFAAFRNQVNGLFSRYDSFTASYKLMQAAMEGNNGVVLAEFGLDGTSDSDGAPDLRRHTELRLLLAWNGKEWKIVDLSPRAMFQ